VTAAPGVQPVAISALANVPEVPKVAADRMASPRPAVLVRITPPVMTKTIYTPDRAYRSLLSGVNVVFAYDTEIGLQAAAALVNTASSDATEPLDTPVQLDAFVARWGWSKTHKYSPTELRAVQDLRPRLREIWSADEDRVVEIVNELLREARALPQLAKHDEWPYHLHAWIPEHSIAERMAVEAAMAVVDVVRTGELERLRVCAADDCEDVVVDLSKNRSRRFCDSGCGNRANVKAYRERQRAVR
jgi:predicted RNA-binding Zn ribbon-like protein